MKKKTKKEIVEEILNEFKEISNYEGTPGPNMRNLVSAIVEVLYNEKNE